MGPIMLGAAISGYAEAAAEVGLDPRAMLRRVGIDQRVLAEPELRVPALKIFELLELSAQVSGCESFGLGMAERRRLSDYGPIALLLAHQPTVREAIMTLIRHQRMLNEALLIDVQDRADGVVAVSHEFVASGKAAMRQAYEAAVGTLIRIFSAPAGPRLHPRSVHFSHGPPSDLSTHRRVFGSGVQFNSDFNGFTCEQADFDSPSAAGDPVLVSYAEGFIGLLPYAREGSVAAEVSKAIHRLLPLDGASIKSVSARLGLNGRTLQRRLAEEGVEFSALLNQIRREHTLRHMANASLPLTQVAGLVGYEREASFARWFAGEFGVTPSIWRASGR
jgi:AraC-like DNA-binding protein